MSDYVGNPVANAPESLGLDYHMLTGFFIDLLRNHFTFNRILNPALRELVWKPMPQAGPGPNTITKIVIESVYKWDPVLTANRPGLFVKFNGQQRQARVIGEEAGRDSRGFVEYMTWWMGAHSVFVVGADGAQVDILAIEVCRFLSHILTPLLSLQGFEDFTRARVSQVSGAGILKEHRDRFASELSISWCLADRWKIVTDAMTIRRFVYDTWVHGTQLPQP